MAPRKHPVVVSPTATEELRRVSVSWLDHWEPDGGPWFRLNELPPQAQPTPITTVGYVAYEDDVVILLVATLDHEHKLVGNPLFLLKAVVQEVLDI